jgi:hypothetical protein
MSDRTATQTRDRQRLVVAGQITLDPLDQWIKTMDITI